MQNQSPPNANASKAEDEEVIREMEAAMSKYREERIRLIQTPEFLDQLTSNVIQRKAEAIAQPD